jgi:hypothetical protein
MHDQSLTPPLDASTNRALPPGVHARQWMDRRECSSSTGEFDAYCLLWLHREDGSVHVLRWPVEYRDRDDLLPGLMQALDAGRRTEASERLVLFRAARLRLRRLHDVPVVPNPGDVWACSDEVLREVRDFEASLDAGILHAFRGLAPYLPAIATVANYNRLASLVPRTRHHRLQALADFPPLVAPLLLDITQPVDGEEAFRAPSDFVPPSQATGLAVLDAMDRGRDLIGALAAHYGVGRALVRSPLCRQPWFTGSIPKVTLRLLQALPATARPATPQEIEARQDLLAMLPLRATHDRHARLLASSFAAGWDATWQQWDARFGELRTAFQDTRDFLAAALAHVVQPPELVRLDQRRLGVAWIARRGVGSLLRASQRWHAAPQGENAEAHPSDCSVGLSPVLEGITLPDGSIEEVISRARLIEEGRCMHHCVATYWKPCVTRGTRIAHLRLANGERATAAYEFLEEAADPRLRLEQLRGPCNIAVSPAMDQFARQVLEAANARDRREQREHILRAAQEAAYVAVPDPDMLRVHRPLDTRSQEELDLVLAWCAEQTSWQRAHVEQFGGLIAGLAFGDGPDVVDQLRVGDRLTLTREPDNPHDRLAVRVDWNGRKLGYLPRPDNAGIARRMDEGARFTGYIVEMQEGDMDMPEIEISVGLADELDQD